MHITMRFAVGILGSASSLFLYTVPILTFRRVLKNKSTENFSCVPYLVTLLNCLLYTFYGLPLVSVGWENALFATVNGIGAVSEIVYITIFLFYCTPKIKKVVARMVCMVILIFGSIAGIAVFALHTHKKKKMIVGIMGIIFSVLMYASPLAAMKLVIKTKSVEFMPFYLSLFSFINSALWLVYGALGRDMYIASPNLVGTPLSILQLVIFCIYKNYEEKDLPDNKEKKGYEVKITIEPNNDTKMQENSDTSVQETNKGEEVCKE